MDFNWNEGSVFVKYEMPEMEILCFDGEVIVTVSVSGPETPPSVGWD